MSFIKRSQNHSLNNIERFNLNDFEIGVKIARYNYGYIAFCKKLTTKKLYAIKIFKKSAIIQNKFAEHVYNEYTNLLQIYHPFIIDFYGINTTDPKYLYFLFEYILGEPLKMLIKKSKKLPLEYAQFYTASLITILDYLHKKKIIYRDLKAENIIINENGYIKLTDFSFSKKINNDFTYSLVGSPEYYSPEMINQGGYNKSVDFWQLGILLYEMVVGYTPFYDSEPMKLYQKIKSGKISFPKNFNKNAKLIIKHFLNVVVNKRLGCTKRGVLEIVEEPFFDNFDWEGLLHRSLTPPFIPKVNRDNYNFNGKFLDDMKSSENVIAIPKEKDIFYNW